jgi:signal transduction histidine kinase
VPEVTARTHDFRHISPAEAGPTIRLVRPEAWLRIAGFGTWLVSSSISFARLLTGELAGTRAGLWLVAFAAFGLAFGAARRTLPRRRSTSIGLLAAQTAASLAMVGAGRDEMCAATLVVVAGQVPWALPAVGAGAWVAAQTVLLALVVGRFSSLVVTFALAAAFGGFQMFAVATALLALRERAAREELARTNAELHATRALVAESSRAAERLRIARDLHDALGHHLTALSLQLDVAARLAEGRAAEHVEKAHAVARLLLADVRDTVSRFREGPASGVADALRSLVPEGGGLAVHLDIPDTLGDLTPDQADVLVRCVQEVITNTMRHAGARNLWIAVSDGADGIGVRARDDGRSAGAVSWGHGLTGMRERFEAFAGRLEVRTGAAGGLEVVGVMPRAPSTP